MYGSASGRPSCSAGHNSYTDSSSASHGSGTRSTRSPRSGGSGWAGHSRGRSGSIDYITNRYSSAAGTRRDVVLFSGVLAPEGVQGDTTPVGLDVLVNVSYLGLLFFG